MRTEIRNRVEMLGEEVVAEVPTTAALRRWLMLRPNDQGGIMLVEFEHDASLDTDEYFAPEDIQNRTRSDFESLDAALDQLRARGVDTDAFVAPWKTDYPL
jgi:hypothetical protein